jgi:hypothetical protein
MPGRGCGYVDRGVDVALVLRAAARAMPATNGQPLAADWAGQGATGAAVVGVDLPVTVRTMAWAFALPKKTAVLVATSSLESLCIKSFLRLATLAWMALTRALLPATWATASAGSRSR